MVAVEKRNHECVKALLANGVDVNVANTVSLKKERATLADLVKPFRSS